MLNQLQEALPDCSITNLYGSSEVTADATACQLPNINPLAGIPISIGRPIANTKVYILDSHGSPVPIGVTGELQIGGAGVARGYLNQPELTSERFIADPFSDSPDARLYKTGDLGRWLPDGTIEFLGRNDFQVKIRGFRIELGEIEARLQEHEAVHDAVVIARENKTTGQQLVAYHVGDGEVSVQSLKDHLATTLPCLLYTSPSPRDRG